MANTPHYNLKLFESTDHPTWLTDWNDTITNIDNALYRIATGGGDLPDLTEVVARLQALEGRVDSDELRLNVIEGDIVSILSDLQNIKDDITALASRVTVNESDIADLKTQANTTLPGQISAINDSITGIIASVSANTTAISGLDSRVTALENAPSAGLSTTILGDIANYTPNSLASLFSTYKMLIIFPISVENPTATPEPCGTTTCSIVAGLFTNDTPLKFKFPGQSTGYFLQITANSRTANYVVSSQSTYNVKVIGVK